MKQKLMCNEIEGEDERERIEDDKGRNVNRVQGL